MIMYFFFSFFLWVYSCMYVCKGGWQFHAQPVLHTALKKTEISAAKAHVLSQFLKNFLSKLSFLADLGPYSYIHVLYIYSGTFWPQLQSIRQRLGNFWTIAWSDLYRRVTLSCACQQARSATFIVTLLMVVNDRSEKKFHKN